MTNIYFATCMHMPKNFMHKYNKSLWKNALIQHIYFLSIYYGPSTELAPLLPKEIRQIPCPWVRNIQMEGTAKMTEDLEHRIYMIRSQENKAPNQALREYRKTSRRRQSNTIPKTKNEQSWGNAASTQKFHWNQMRLNRGAVSTWHTDPGLEYMPVSWHQFRKGFLRIWGLQ